MKTSADKTLQNSGLRIAVMLDGVDVFRTDSTLQIPAGDSIHLKQDADVVTWNGGTREQLGVTCENPWLGRTIIQSDTAVLDWENSRESNNAQTAEQHPENGIDTNVCLIRMLSKFCRETYGATARRKISGASLTGLPFFR